MAGGVVIVDATLFKGAFEIGALILSNKYVSPAQLHGLIPMCTQIPRVLER